MEAQADILPHVSHVFVDEFQDSNPIQFSLHTGWLANESVRLTVVGDDDQAIYRFRGSDIGCFNELGPFCSTGHIPYRLDTLDINHRSTRTVVAFSQAFKSKTGPATQSMAKTIGAPASASLVIPVASARTLVRPVFFPRG